MSSHPSHFPSFLVLPTGLGVQKGERKGLSQFAGGKGLGLALHAAVQYRFVMVMKLLSEPGEGSVIPILGCGN